MSGTKARAIVAIEGWDAAGKGGLIQRLTEKLDPRSVAVWRIAAPRPDEQGRHYLYRFWNKLPAAGEMAVFDRTWYGRVLVERIEGFCAEPAWRRAYGEINQFERQLSDDGVRVIKLLLHVSKEEQRRRIVERIETPEKRYKVGMEDFRNVSRRSDYLEAFDELLEKTDTDNAPWHVIATDSKKRARISGLEYIADLLARVVDLTPPPLDPAIAQAAKDVLGWDPSKPAKSMLDGPDS